MLAHHLPLLFPTVPAGGGDGVFVWGFSGWCCFAGLGEALGALLGPLLRRARPRTITVNILISFLRSCFFCLVVCVCSLVLAHHLPLLFPTVPAGGGVGVFVWGFSGWCCFEGLGEALGALLGPSSGEHVRGPLSLSFS